MHYPSYLLFCLSCYRGIVHIQEFRHFLLAVSEVNHALLIGLPDCSPPSSISANAGLTAYLCLPGISFMSSCALTWARSFSKNAPGWVEHDPCIPTLRTILLKKGRGVKKKGPATGNRERGMDYSRWHIPQSLADSTIRCSRAGLARL
jgi:hypothetical protein